MNDLKLITVFDDLPVGLILINNKGIIDVANRAFLENNAKGKNNLQGIAFDTLLVEKHKKAFSDFLRNANNQGSQSVQQFEMADSLRGMCKIDLRWYPANQQQARILLGRMTESPISSAYLKEIEKQQQLKESIKDKLEEESELSEMKSRFLSIASHEIRTPLAGMLSSLNLMSRYLNANEHGKLGPANKEKVLKHIDKIKESVRNLTNILNKSLAMSNIEKGEIPINYSSFDIKSTLEAQKILHQQLCKPGQKINYTHKGKDRIVFLDLYLLKNIINNLLSNAIKYSAEKTTMQLTSLVNPNDVQLIIADNGIGIPNAEQKYIFRRFYRAKNALAFDEGTGLGLNIVKKYVELMDGSISFESTEGVGTTFNITFKTTKKTK